MAEELLLEVCNDLCTDYTLVWYLQNVLRQSYDQI
jgi:hypothetical protein